MASDSLARLLVGTIEAVAARAPAILAAAARQLGAIRLALHFGDGTHARLRSERSRLVAGEGRDDDPDVEVHFDAASMNLLFDLERRPADEVLAGSLDVRGGRDEVLAVWRTFRLLSQRASGLRVVQALWRQHRDGRPDLWGTIPAPAGGNGRRPGDSGWSALDYLAGREPSGGPERALLAGSAVRTTPFALWDGRRSVPWTAAGAELDADLKETLEAGKARVQAELDRIIPDREPAAELYDLMREYPRREGKGLRPTLTLASCVALGGRSEDAVRIAAAIELFHNGFLVHDDIADESTHRRNEPTLHEKHGAGLAVNAGDAMNLLAVDTTLSNLKTLGLARTLALIHEILHMCRETVEGQAIELGWIADCSVPARDEDYFRMSTKKTGWYTCISPCRLGAVCAGETDPAVLDRFNEVMRLVGIAFQIQDDVLNLVGARELYGKEELGDLYEGKRTVMLIHLFREGGAAVRARAEAVIRKRRREKSEDDVRFLLDAMRREGSIDYAIDLADRLAHEGVRRFEEDLAFLPESEAKGVLRQIANYVTTRPL